MTKLWMNFYRAHRSFLFIIPKNICNCNIKSAFYMDKTQFSGKKASKEYMLCGLYSQVVRTIRRISA